MHSSCVQKLLFIYPNSHECKHSYSFFFYQHIFLMIPLGFPVEPITRGDLHVSVRTAPDGRCAHSPPFMLQLMSYHIPGRAAISAGHTSAFYGDLFL